MEYIKILHLSDMHLSKKNISNQRKIIGKIIEDYKNNIDNYVDLVIISGDLVNSGEATNFDLAYEIINKIKSSLNVDDSNIIYIPGNHEVNTNDIKTYYFNGLDTANDKKSWENYNYNKDLDLCHHMTEYIKFQYSVNFNNDIINTKIININKIKLGIAMANSAWFSKGSSKEDINKIFIPSKKINDAYDSICNCDLKIFVMHHPYKFFKYEYMNDVEQALGKFDLVLSGHTHEANYTAVNTIPGNKAIFLTGNEITDQVKNGYSIYKISKEKQEMKAYFRKYYKKREEFDADCELFSQGETIFELSDALTVDKKMYAVNIKTKNNYIKSLDDLMITSIIDKNLNKDFIANYVMPKLTKLNGDDLTNDREEINFEEILKINYNKVFIKGKKEVGKTIFANYIAYFYYENYNNYKKIPVVINFKEINTRNNDYLVNAIKEKLNQYTTDDYSISKNIVKELLNNDKLVLIFDDCARDANLQELLNKINDMKLSKTIFMFESSLKYISYEKTEEIIQNIKGDTNTLNIFIEEFSKSQIRQYSKNLLGLNNIHIDELCTKTVELFHAMSLPKTPFVVSLFISICNIDSDFEPTNKAKIIEKLMDIMLEKISPSDIFLKSYGFDSKCSFLSEMAYNMYLNNQYYYTFNDYEEFVINYHKEKMFPLEDTKFDKIFFEKNILILENGKVKFRFKCFIDYFLAVYFSKNQNEILKIANSEYYYNYVDLFEYYTGINKNDEKLAEIICGKFLLLIDKNINLKELFDLSIIEKELFKDFNEEKVNNIVPLSEEEKDQITDIVIDSDYNPENINVRKERTRIEQLMCSMSILGNIIRNSEDLSGNLKVKYLKHYMNGAVCIIGKIFESFKNMLFLLKEQIMNEVESDSKKIRKIEKMFNVFSDVMKITIPLVVQSDILEFAGTRKLKTVIEKIINGEELLDDFELFNYIALYSDLRISNWETLYINFIKRNNNSLIRTLIFFKCWNYLRMDYFNDNMKSGKEVLYMLYQKNGLKKQEINNEIDYKIKTLRLRGGNEF